MKREYPNRCVIKLDKIEAGLVSLAVVSVVTHLLIGPYQDPLYDAVEIILYLTPPIVAVISSGYLLKRFWKSSIPPLFLGLFLGLFLWLTAEITWEIYRCFLAIEIPYPSVADVVWIIGYIPFGYVMVSLYNMSKIALKTKTKVVSLAFASLMAIIVAFFLIEPLLIYPSDDLATTFFDLAYPLFDVFFAFFSISILFSLLVVKRGLKWFPVPLFFAINVLADLLFSYLTSQEMYFNGHPVDVLWMLAYWVIAYGCYKAETFDFLARLQYPKIEKGKPEARNLSVPIH